MTQFSPVVKSPATRGLQKNLTGNARVVRDLAAVIHSSVQQWNSLHLHGLSILKNITAVKNDESYPEELEQLCEDLSKCCTQLDEIVENLGQAVLQLNAVKSLHKGPEKLFKTWPVERFAQTAKVIYEAYREEAEIKTKVLENIAHDHRDSLKMLHLAAWVHQTKIHDGVTTALESMLTETGHR